VLPQWCRAFSRLGPFDWDFSYDFFVLGPIRTRALSFMGPFIFSYQACFVLVIVWDYAVRARMLPAPEPSEDSHQTLVIRAHGMIPRTVDVYIVCKHFTTAEFLVNDQNSAARLVRTGPVRKIPSTKGPTRMVPCTKGLCTNGSRCEYSQNCRNQSTTLLFSMVSQIEYRPEHGTGY